jgi:cell wall-associated NlpC family hydrolase
MLWRGVPYQHRGTTRAGCDCTGLIIGVLKELGYLKWYVLRKYAKDWNLHAGADDYLVREISKIADPVMFGTAGDIILFRFGRCTAHAGIVIDNGLFIHNHVNARKCTIGKLSNSPWSKRIAGYYRIREDRL